MGKSFLRFNTIDLKGLSIGGFYHYKITSNYLKLIFIDRVKNTI
jgi:hypothetical protein